MRERKNQGLTQRSKLFVFWIISARKVVYDKNFLVKSRSRLYHFSLIKFNFFYKKPIYKVQS